MAWLAGLREVALERLPLLLLVRIALLNLWTSPRLEGQQKGVQVAAVAHQLHIICRPAGIVCWIHH